MIIIGELINDSRKAVKAAIQKKATIFAAAALAGRDDFCMKYLKAFRAGLLE